MSGTSDNRFQSVRKSRGNSVKFLFDFLKNRKYNNNKRVAGKRKSSFLMLVFLLFRKVFPIQNNIKIIIAVTIRKCAACQRKSSLYDRGTLFLQEVTAMCKVSSVYKQNIREVLQTAGFAEIKRRILEKWQKATK